MKRFYYYNHEIVPKVINEEDNNCEYYYDMEFMENYNQLDTYNISVIKSIFPHILNNMKQNTTNQ